MTYSVGDHFSYLGDSTVGSDLTDAINSGSCDGDDDDSGWFYRLESRRSVAVRHHGPTGSSIRYSFSYDRGHAARS